MSVAGFVLGLIATVLATASLGWQVVTFLRRKPRPKLTAVVGRLTAEGLVTNDASGDVRESLADATEQLGDIPLIIGVKVANAGGSPFHVSGWAIRSDPDGTFLMPVKKPIAGAEVPHDIPPGGSAVFLTELRHAHLFARAAASGNGESPNPESPDPESPDPESPGPESPHAENPDAEDPGAESTDAASTHAASTDAASTDGASPDAESVGTQRQQPRVVLTVSSGARTYATKPIAPELISLDKG